MKSLLQNESLRKNYIEKGLQRAKEFTWSASAEKLVKIYKRFQ
jgi:glycosyltransferase involved in cell wall biosynthesis